MKKKFLIAILAVIILAIAVIFFYLRAGPKEDFEIGSGFIKTVLRGESESKYQIKLENLRDYGRNFILTFTDLENLTILDSSEIYLDAGEIDYVNVSFANLHNVSAGIYSGGLNILSEDSSRSQPIIVEVESKDVLFDGNVNIYPTTQKLPGDEITAEIKIFDLSFIGISSIEIDYFIRDFSGNIIFSESGNVVVEDQLVVTKGIVLPKTLKKGDYIFGVILKYKNSIGTTSTIFSIGDKKTGMIFGDLFSYILIFVFIIFIFLLFVFYSMYSRDKLFDELKKQYKQELFKENRKLAGQQEKNEKLLKTKQEKMINRQLFMQTRIARKKAINKIQAERVKILKKLKKEHKRDEMSRQIEEWKKKGYNISILKDGKIPTIEDIEKQIKKWKKQGYNTKVLEND